jgi:hypothetical protein
MGRASYVRAVLFRSPSLLTHSEEQLYTKHQKRKKEMHHRAKKNGINPVRMIVGCTSCAVIALLGLMYSTLPFSDVNKRTYLGRGQQGHVAIPPLPLDITIINANPSYSVMPRVDKDHLHGRVDLDLSSSFYLPLPPLDLQSETVEMKAENHKGT